MENASKALIIAGAILISILLISVGIIIMNAINEPVQQSANSANSQAVQAFNADFTAYEGEQKGATLKGFMAKINAINSANPDDQVTVNGAAGPFNISTIPSYSANGTYDVTLDYNGTGGRVSNVAIQVHP